MNGVKIELKMMEYNITPKLENLLERFYKNLISYGATFKENADVKTASIVHVDEGGDGGIRLLGTPERNRQYIKGILSLFGTFFNAHGLNEENWNDFLATYYIPLNQDAKDKIVKTLLDCDGLLILKERTILSRDIYAKIQTIGPDSQKLINTPNLSSLDINNFVMKYFSENDVKGGSSEDSRKPTNQYINSILQDRENKEGLKSFLGMFSRSIPLQRKNLTSTRELDRLMPHSIDDKLGNYDIGNCTKASSVWQIFKTQT